MPSSGQLLRALQHGALVAKPHQFARSPQPLPAGFKALMQSGAYGPASDLLQDHDHPAGGFDVSRVRQVRFGKPGTDEGEGELRDALGSGHNYTFSDHEGIHLFHLPRPIVPSLADRIKRGVTGAAKKAAWWTGGSGVEPYIDPSHARISHSASPYAYHVANYLKTGSASHLHDMAREMEQSGNPAAIIVKRALQADKIRERQGVPKASREDLAEVADNPAEGEQIGVDHLPNVGGRVKQGHQIDVRVLGNGYARSVYSVHTPTGTTMFTAPLRPHEARQFASRGGSRTGNVVSPENPYESRLRNLLTSNPTSRVARQLPKSSSTTLARQWPTSPGSHIHDVPTGFHELMAAGSYPAAKDLLLDHDHPAGEAMSETPTMTTHLNPLTRPLTEEFDGKILKARDGKWMYARNRPGGGWRGYNLTPESA